MSLYEAVFARCRPSYPQPDAQRRVYIPRTLEALRVVRHRFLIEAGPGSGAEPNKEFLDYVRRLEASGNYQARLYLQRYADYKQGAGKSKPPQVPFDLASGFDAEEAQKKAAKRAQQDEQARRAVEAARAQAGTISDEHRDAALELMGHSEDFYDAHHAVREAKNHVDAIRAVNDTHKDIGSWQQRLGDARKKRDAAHAAIMGGLKAAGVSPVHINHALQPEANDVHPESHEHMDAVAHLMGGEPREGGGYSFPADGDGHVHFHAWASVHHGDRLPVLNTKKRSVTFKQNMPVDVGVSQSALRRQYRPGGTGQASSMADVAKGYAEGLQEKIASGTQIHMVRNVRNLQRKLFEIKIARHHRFAGMRSYVCPRGHYIHHSGKGTAEQKNAIAVARRKVAEHIEADHPTTEWTTSQTLAALLEWTAACARIFWR